MREYIMSVDSCKSYKFEIVGRIPSGYVVWNIGNNMGADDLIPLAQRMSNDKKSDDYYRINPDTLKAIRLEAGEVKILREAAGFGVDNLKAARSWEKREGRTYISSRKHAAAVESLPIFERISE